MKTLLGLISLAFSLSRAWAQTYTYTTFDPPGSTATTVNGINNAQQVVGTYKDSSGTSHSFIRQADGTYTVFEMPGAVPGTTDAVAINNLGQVVGSYELSNTNQMLHGFIRSADGRSYTSFDVPGGQFTAPTGINDQGEIIGQQFSERNPAVGAYGFLRSADGSTYTTISVPGAHSTLVLAINNSGQTVGRYSFFSGSLLTGDISHGFLRDRDGTYVEFEVPGYIEGSLPCAINNKGQILSPSYLVNPDRSSIWIEGPPTARPDSINDNGVIAGTNYVSPVNHGYLAIPAGTPGTGPQIRSVLGVMSASAFGGYDAVSPGTWIEIYGANLANTTRQWQISDFNGNNAPTSLDGVSVAINGQPAFVSYVSPGQVNAQVPSTENPGAVTVSITNGSQTSGSYAVPLNAVEPGVLMIAVNYYYAAALFPDFTTYALPPGITTTVPTRQARPGDTLIFYGIGFGSVMPDAQAGQIVSGLHLLQGNVQVTIANMPAQVTYAGLSPGAVGLYQFNVVVPEIKTAGPSVVPVIFTLNGSVLMQPPHGSGSGMWPFLIGYAP
jgi:uncharacterized protein (TIGR03437 family)